MFSKKNDLAAQLVEALRAADKARHDDKDADCPLWQAPCKEHKCRWYVQVQGFNPNTGVQENRFDCAMAWLPVLQIETSQQARQAGASSDKVATEVRKFHNKMVHMNLKADAREKFDALEKDLNNERRVLPHDERGANSGDC